MKKVLVVLISIMSIIEVSQARVRPIVPRQIPNYAQSYNSGYTSGYKAGRKDKEEQVIKVIGASILIATSAIILYNLVKPSEYNQGHVQLARF